MQEQNISCDNCRYYKKTCMLHKWLDVNDMHKTAKNCKNFKPVYKY